MQIKPQALAPTLQRKTWPLSALVGNDHYLLDQAFTTIKTHIKSANECDERMLTVQAADDWRLVREEANSYSLFASCTLLNIVYDKKTLDVAGKKALTEYLESKNDRCFMILRAPNLPAKQLTWLTNHEQALIVLAYPLPADGMKLWIATQLKTKSFSFTKEVPDIIYQYTQGNMLASAQVIEKLSLTHDNNSQIAAQDVLDHVFNQCDHNLYELVDACLLGQADKSVQILRQAANNKTESTLVLWMLTQEVRTLMQLIHAQNQKIDFKSACAQVKIWPQRVSMYQMALKRMQPKILPSLLHYCKTIDEYIKTGTNGNLWEALECLAISLALGRGVGV